MMASHTVSDREKAELMLAEQKMTARTAPPPPPTPSSSPSPVQSTSRQPMAVMANCQRRQYSTNGSRRRDKSKVLAAAVDGVGRKRSRRFRMPFCAAARIGGCSKKAVKKTLCSRKLAPYPAYSEFCVTVPYRRPTECRDCPWKIHKHPTYKSPMQRFHTGSSDLKNNLKNNSSSVGSNTINNMINNNTINNNMISKNTINNNTISLTTQKANNKINTKQIEKSHQQFREEVDKVLAKPNNLGFKIHSSIGCLDNKPPCKQPPGQCEDARPKDAAEKARRANLNKDECKDKHEPTKKKKSAGISLGDQIGSWLHQVSRRKTPFMEAVEAQEILAANKTDGGGKTPKKFPFKEESFPLVKERKPRPRQLKPGQCPKEKSKKLINDCPPSSCGRPGQCHTLGRISQGAVFSGGMVPPAAGSNGGNGGYLMADSDEKGGDGKKKAPCKKFELPKCNLPHLNPQTWQCPKDLVIRHTPGYRPPREKKDEKQTPKEQPPQEVPKKPPPTADLSSICNILPKDASLMIALYPCVYHRRKFQNIYQNLFKPNQP